MKKINLRKILASTLYKSSYLILSFICCFISKGSIAQQCSSTSKTFGAKSSFIGNLGTDIVRVKVTPPDSVSVLYGLCTTNNANGFKVDTSCGGPYNTNFMWGFFKTDTLKKIATLTTTTGATACPNRPIRKPTLTLTIPSTSPYQWSYDDINGLVYVKLTKLDTLIFTISETDSTSTTQVNNYFNNCSDTSLRICSNLNWNFYNDPNPETVTGLPGFLEKDKFFIWPNPTNDILNLSYKHNQLSEINVDLIDQTGRIIRSKRVENLNGYLMDFIDLRQLNAGLYFLKIKVGNETLIRKIFKSD